MKNNIIKISPDRSGLSFSETFSEHSRKVSEAEEVDFNKAKILYSCFIYVMSDDRYGYSTTGNPPTSHMVGAIETVKFDLLENQNDCQE